MLTYGDDKKREDFRAAVERAREDGLSPAEMASMITAAKSEPPPTNGAHPKDMDAADVIYEPGELPEGLIDLPSAAVKYSEEYGVSEGAMRQWVNRGRVAKVGRVRAPARGGGYLVVNEDELVKFMGRPRNKGGRPPKGPK